MKLADRQSYWQIVCWSARLLLLVSVGGAIAVVAATYMVDFTPLSRADHRWWCASIAVDAFYVILIQTGFLFVLVFRYAHHKSAFLKIGAFCFIVFIVLSMAAMPVAYRAPDSVSRIIELWALRLHGLLAVSGASFLYADWQSSLE